MLPSNFDSLTADRPELTESFSRLAKLINEHPNWNEINPREIRKFLGHNVDKWQMANALDYLVERGWLHQVYVVITPSGVMANDEFEDPSDIPERLPDRFNQYFDTAEADVVPILKP